MGLVRVLLLRLTTACASAACASAPAPALATTVVAVNSSEFAEVFGQWSWTHRSHHNGHLTRVENETWTLHPDPNDNTLIRGFYLRRVRFLSENETPFVCNQHSEFTLVTHIELFGSRNRDTVAIREIKRTRKPSLCAPPLSETVSLRAYTLSRSGPTLVATSDGIRQQLSPSIQPLPREPTPQPQLQPAAVIEGTWQWQGWHRESGQIIESHEVWSLKRTADGGSDRIHGSYRRSVTISTVNGRPLACDPNTSRTQWEQVFEISGSISGPATREVIRLTEVQASWVATTRPAHELRGVAQLRRLQDTDAFQPRCARGETTHLDSAQGRLVSSQLELRWRSGRRQVLRQDPHHLTSAAAIRGNSQ